MGLLNSHLDDAAFADVWADRLAYEGGSELERRAEAHLRSCPDCRTRYAEFSGWMEGVRADAHADADDVFTSERLASQQALIFRRLEGLEHPAKVIAFPRFTRPVSYPSSNGRRWIAVAAAAGLVVGIGLGQVFEVARSGGARQTAAVAQPQQIARGTIPVPEATRLGVQPVSNASDEVFVYELDAAPSQARVPESLQYLNDITPSARDYDR